MFHFTWLQILYILMQKIAVSSSLSSSWQMAHRANLLSLLTFYHCCGCAKSEQSTTHLTGLHYVNARSPSQNHLTGDTFQEHWKCNCHLSWIRSLHDSTVRLRYEMNVVLANARDVELAEEELCSLSLVLIYALSHKNVSRLAQTLLCMSLLKREAFTRSWM